MESEDYTLLDTCKSETDFSRIHSTSASISIQVARPRLSTTEEHIAKANEISRIYQLFSLEHKCQHQDSWKLFRTLFHFWKETGQTRISTHHLSILLQSQNESEPSLQVVNSAKFIDDAIQRRFPVQWADSRYHVDFSTMVKAIEELPSLQLHRRRSSALLYGCPQL